MKTVVIVGAGQAGASSALALREAGFEGRIVLIGEEHATPYQRPPLSKAFLQSKLETAALALRPLEAYVQRGIGYRPGEQVVAIDRAQRQVSLARGETIGYDHLVLATGLRPRIPDIPGIGLEGVMPLRTLEEAAAMRQRLRASRRLVAIGAGFVGMEVAASAASLGIQASIIDVAPRVLARAVSPPVSAHLAELHDRAGSSLHLGRTVREITGKAGRARKVLLDDGTTLAADLVVIGIGSRPRTELAEAAGLAVADGIVVDAFLLTADPAISAIGDCARFPCPYAADSAEGRVRLESVQNATDQARCVASFLTDKPREYAAVPWFWSDQLGAKVQIAGLTAEADTSVVQGDPASGAFSVHRFGAGRWLGVESVNRPADHMAARKLLAAGRAPQPEQLASPGFELKTFAAT